MSAVFKNLTEVLFLKRLGTDEDIQLGKGGFSLVKLVAHKDFPEKKFALKIIKKNGKLNPSYIRKEIQIHQNLKHPNIVSFNAHFEDEVNFYLVLEYLQNGNLYEHLKKA